MSMEVIIIYNAISEPHDWADVRSSWNDDIIIPPLTLLIKGDNYDACGGLTRASIKKIFVAFKRKLGHNSSTPRVK